MRTITCLIVLTAPALVLVYDLLAEHFGGHDATITATIQKASQRFPEIPAISAAFMVWLWLHLFLNHIIARVNQHVPPLDCTK